MTVTIHPSAVRGVLAAPPSKSAAHRAIICAALADGVSRLENIDFSQDIEATLAAVRQLGAKLTREKNAVTVTGCGGAFATVTHPVFCRESGSTLRFLVPLFSLTAQKITFTGAGRLFARPLAVYADVFAAQGLRFAQQENGLVLQGQLRAARFTLPGDVSSQFVSGLLFAAPLLERASEIEVRPPFESRSYVDMTLDALRRFGIEVGVRTLPRGGAVYTVAPQHYRPADVAVEGDYSQAAFIAALGALTPGGLGVRGLAGVTRQGDRVILELLHRFGAAIHLPDMRPGTAAAPDDTVTVAPGEAPLHGIDIDLADCPDLGPILITLACFAEGTTTIRNAGRLRLKESDRIAAMQQELGKLGAAVRAGGDTVTVEGAGPAALHAPRLPLEAHNDHRIAMSLTVAALAGGFDAELYGAESVAKSWPQFFAALRTLGADITEEETDG